LLEGRVVRLRDLRPTDMVIFLGWRNDPEISQYLSTPSVEPDELENWFGKGEGDTSATYMGIETATGQLIGYIGLREIDWTQRSAMLVIVIGEKNWWNQGLGEDAVNTLLDYAFSSLSLQKVSLSVLPFNTRAIRCYEKAGFRRVGFFGEYYFRQGRLWRPIHMEITADQFRVARRIKG